MFKKIIIFVVIFLSTFSLVGAQTAGDGDIYLIPAISETAGSSNTNSPALIGELYRMIAEIKARIRVLSEQKNETRSLTTTNTTPVSTQTRVTTPIPASPPQPVQPNTLPNTPAQPIQSPTISSFSPPSGSVDARNPNGGFMTISARTPVTPTVDNYPTSDFSVSTTRGDLPLSINNLSYSGGENSIVPVFNRQILNGERIRLTHKPSGASACFGFLPGDVDSSGVVAGADHLAIIDAINGTRTLSNYSTDINRSGDTNPADILAFVDGFNGGWLGASLPACPSPAALAPTQDQLANILASLRAILSAFNSFSTH